MKNLKKEKGITLIALIITIVVLLILAVVAIGAVRDSNIIGYAQNAAKDYNTAKDEQDVLLKEYETEIEKYLPNDNITKTGVKAYNFNGSIMIFTPENEFYQYDKDTDFFPSYKIELIEVKIENDPTYDITIDTNDFTQEEISKMHLVTATGMNGIGAYFDGEGGRDTLYITPVASGVTEVTITKSMPIQHSDELLAQYYHETTNGQYFYGEMVDEGGIIWGVNDVEGDQFFCTAIVLRGIGGIGASVGKKRAVEIVQNETPFNIKLDGEDYTIRTDAKIVTVVDNRCAVLSSR